MREGSTPLPGIGEQSCDERICLHVQTHISGTTCPHFLYMCNGKHFNDRSDSERSPANSGHVCGLKL